MSPEGRISHKKGRSLGRAVTHVPMRRGILLAGTLVCHQVTVLSKASTLNACAALFHAASGQGNNREEIMRKSRLGEGE